MYYVIVFEFPLFTISLVNVVLLLLALVPDAPSACESDQEASQPPHADEGPSPRYHVIHQHILRQVVMGFVQLGAQNSTSELGVVVRDNHEVGQIEVEGRGKLVGGPD